MKKIYWGVAILFLFTFGVLNGVLRRQVSFLLMGGSVIKDSLSFFDGLDFIFGVLYPVIIVFSYFFIVKISALLYDYSVEKEILFYILSFLFPLFVFQFINLYYLFDLSADTLKQINERGNGYIIPIIDVRQSKRIMNFLTLLPLVGVVSYLFYEKRVKIVDIIKIMVTPIFVFICIYLIVYYG